MQQLAVKLLYIYLSVNHKKDKLDRDVAHNPVQTYY